MYVTETLCWSKPVLDSEVVTPTSRRAHTAVVFGAVMNVFGGYVDLRGSSSQLWNFDLGDLSSVYLYEAQKVEKIINK